MNDLRGELRSLLLEGAGHWTAPNIGADVFGQIEEFANRFLVDSDEHASTIRTLWIAQTGFLDIWTKAPRLLVISPEPNCGKSTLLEILRCFVPRPDLMSGTTEAGLYQAITDCNDEHGAPPTILLDQLDKIFGNAELGRRHHPGIENVLETGFNSSGILKRKMRGKSVRINVFAPMALAGTMDLGFVPDAVVSRSIIVRMFKRSLPGERENWNDRSHPRQAKRVGKLLQMWAELVREAVREQWAAVPVPPGLSARDADKWRPLLIMADLAGGDWPQRARAAAVAAVAASRDSTEANVPTQLLRDIRTVFDAHKGATRLRTAEILEALLAMELAPWRRMRLEVNGLSRILRGFEIRPTQWREGRTTGIRGYQRADFEDAWLRFLEPATPATPATRKGARRG